MKGERSFGGMNIDFAEAIEFLGWAAFLEHSGRSFADRMIAGRAVGPSLCTVTFGTPCRTREMDSLLLGLGAQRGRSL